MYPGALLVVPGRLFRFLLEHTLHQAQTDGRGKPERRWMTHCCLRCCLDSATRWLQCECPPLEPRNRGPLAPLGPGRPRPAHLTT